MHEAFLRIDTKLSHSSVYFILRIIHFTTLFSFTCINLLIILEAVDKIFPLCGIKWFIYFMCICILDYLL